MILLKNLFSPLQNSKHGRKTTKKPATRGLSKTVVRKLLAYTITATGVETLKPEVQEEDI